MRLAEVRGHDRLKAALARALERDRVPPALLFAGPEGVGKKTLALAAARAVLCEHAPAPEPCGHCRTCTSITAGFASLEALRRRADSRPDEDVWRNFRLHPDLVLAEGWPLTKTGRPRAEPEIRVDQARELIAETAAAPFQARRRVFIIDDAHTMNDQAQNALLKSLEEPPPRSHLLLVSAAPLRLLQTIRSRCRTLRFGPLPRAVVESVLRERPGFPGEDVRTRAALAGGSIAAALALESESYQGMREALLALLESLNGLTALGRLQAAQQLEQSENPTAMLTTLRSLLRDIAAAHAGADPLTLVNADLGRRLAALAATPLGPRAIELAHEAARARGALKGFALKLLTFDVLVDALAGD